MAEDLDLAQRVAAALAAMKEPAPAAAQKPKARKRWHTLPVYTHRRFKCPRCGCSQFDSHRMRSWRQEDESSKQYKVCSGCGHEFILKVL